MRWTKNGSASLDVFINNGPSREVQGLGLTTEEAVEAVCSYLPVRPASFTDEDVERVAKAIWESSDPPKPWGQRNAAEHQDTVDLARAALDAFLKAPE